MCTRHGLLEQYEQRLLDGTALSNLLGISKKPTKGNTPATRDPKQALGGTGRCPLSFQQWRVPHSC